MKVVSNPIFLLTSLTESGLLIGVSDVVDILPEAAIEVETQSEGYLKVIEDAVKKEGGWERVQSWYVNATSESFTSSRGLATLVNTLAPMHEVTVYIFNDQLSGSVEAKLPMSPKYSSEPNISKRKS